MESWCRMRDLGSRPRVGIRSEEKAAAVRMVRALRAELGTEHGTVQRVATQLGYGIESVRTWVKQADIDDGNVAGVTTAESRKLRELEQEVRELRRANEILKRAASFFGAELDRQNRSSRVHRREQERRRRRPPPRSRAHLQPVAGGSSSTYYAAKDRAPSARAVSDAVLMPKLVTLWNANYCVYGSASSGRPPAAPGSISAGTRRAG